MDDSRLRLIRVRAENAQRIELVDETINGEHLIVEGRNGGGKSSLLNAICMAIGGKRFAAETPIRRGTRRARVMLDLGQIEIERTMTERSDTVVVTNKGRDGQPYPRPQEFLNGLFSLVAFDPSAFERMKPQDQARTLRALSGLDTTALDARRAEAYEMRTQLGRDLRRARGHLDTLEPVLDAPEQPVDISQLAEELAHAEQTNRRAIAWANEMQQLRDRSEALKRQIEELTQELHQVQARGRQLMQDKPQQIDTAPIVRRMRDAEQANARYRSAVAMRQAMEEVQQLEQQVEQLTVEIEQIDQQRAEALAACRMPIEGLSVEGDTVLYNGIPLQDCSQSERLLVLGTIGAALNPRMGFCILRDAAWFDPETMRLFLQQMQERGVQVIAERPGRDEFATIVLEAGRVVDRRGEPVSEPDPDPDTPVSESQTETPAETTPDPFDGQAESLLDSEEFWS